MSEAQRVFLLVYYMLLLLIKREEEMPFYIGFFYGNFLKTIFKTQNYERHAAESCDSSVMISGS
jgi:hypothetical protein